MYIYNRINRFLAGAPPHFNQFTFRGSSNNNKNGYKIKRRKPSKNIKSASVRVSRPKLKSLTKKNIEFLKNLGYKVIN